MLNSKKIAMMGMSAMMVVSAMSVSAFATTNIDTCVVNENSDNVPFEITATVNNNSMVSTTIQIPVEKYDSVSMEIQPVDGGNMLYDGNVFSNVTNISGINLYDGYYLTINTVNDGQKTAYQTDFVMYKQANKESGEILNTLEIFTGDVISASGSENVSDADMELSIQEERSNYNEMMENNLPAFFSTGTLTDGAIKYGNIATSEDVDSYSYTVSKNYVNFYLGMKSIKAGNTYGLTVPGSNGNVINISGTKGHIPYTVNAGDADDVKNCYFPLNTQLTIEIDGKNGSCDPTANYEVKVKGYRTQS